jgi:hypothetical protein
LAITGSLLGAISGAMVFMVAGILSLIVSILIVVSKDEFD